MKRYLSLLAVVASLCSARAQEATTQIVAHRGYWDDNAQNSIASLKKAQEFGCWGSEFDLHLTADNQVVVNHDPTIGGIPIQSSLLDDVRGQHLKNGEQLSTLDEYLEQGQQDEKCVLVLELKPHKSQEREDRLMDECLNKLQERQLLDPGRIVFISFSYYICKQLAARCPGITVQYLEGDKTPAEVHQDGISGIDYHYSYFKKHPEWVQEAHDLGMSVNAWTVDKPEDIRLMRDLGVDQITTNQPALVREILAENL